jgi:hypothetical protein
MLRHRAPAWRGTWRGTRCGTWYGTRARQHVTHARHVARAAGDGVGLRLVAVRRRHAAARRPLRPALAPAGSRLAGGGGVPGVRRRRRGPPPPPPSPAPRYAFSPFPLPPPPYSPTAARPVEHLQVCAE